MLNEEQFRENLTEVTGQIERLCLEFNRSPDEVTLLPVTKKWPSEAVRFCQRAGISRVGENRVQDALVKQLKAADASLSHADCLTLLSEWMGAKASWEDDKAVLQFFEAEGAVIDEKLGAVRAESVKKTVAALLDSLSADAKAEVLKSL